MQSANPLIHNSIHELGDGEMHWPFNSMLGLVWHNFSKLPPLSFSDNAFHFFGRADKTPADGLGPGCAARLAPSKLFLGEREKVFPSLPFWLNLSRYFPYRKNVNERHVLRCRGGGNGVISLPLLLPLRSSSMQSSRVECNYSASPSAINQLSSGVSKRRFTVNKVILA